MATLLTPALRSALEAALPPSRMKGIAAVVGRASHSPEVVTIGTDAADRPLTRDSLFPVASVTKLATALAVLRLVDAGSLDLDDPLARHIPEAIAAAHPGVTLRRLLSHTAGLPMDVSQGKARYSTGLNWPVLAEACIQTPLREPPFTRVQYSNVGYGLLAVVVERKTGRDFPSALKSMVLDPLAIEGYLGSVPPRSTVKLAGIRGAHAKTSLEPFNSDFWQSLALPWAGLLTTPEGALGLVRGFLETPADFLRPETVADALRNQTNGLDGGFARPLLWSPSPWGLGPDLRDQKSPHWTPAPPTISPESFGHSGASGCLVWADPSRGVAWGILGTRTADSGWLLHRGPALSEAILQGV